MTLLQSFSLTSDLMDMVNQFKRGPDLIKTPEGVRLSNNVADMIDEDSKNFQPGELEVIYQKAADDLQDDFSKLIKDNFDLILVGFNLKKDQGRLGKLTYKLELMVDDYSGITLNISKLGANPGNDYVLLLKEKPSLCWIMDSRSPFHIPGFAEMLEDIAAVTSFQSLLSRDHILRESILHVLGKRFIGVLN